MNIHPPAWLADGLANVRAFMEPCNVYQVRAGFRMFGGLIPGAFLASALLDLPDAAPGGDRMIDVGMAVTAAILLLAMLKWFGQDRGVLFGLGLWTISYLWFQGLVATTYAIWLALDADGGPTEWGVVVTLAVLGAVLFVPCNMGLKRLDPDF